MFHSQLLVLTVISVVATAAAKKVPKCCNATDNSYQILTCTNCTELFLGPNLQATSLTVNGGFSFLKPGIFENVSRSLIELVLRSNIKENLGVDLFVDLKSLKFLTVEAAEKNSGKSLQVPLLLRSLPALQKLRLSGIKVTSLPTNLSPCGNISSFALMHAQLTSVNEGALVNMNGSLQHLDFSGNPGLLVNKSLRETNWLRNLSKLENLSISNTSYNGSDKQLNLLTLMNLRWLNLSRNHWLIQLPPELIKLRQLRYLDVSDSRLARILDNVFPEISELEVLLLLRTNLSNVVAAVFDPLNASLRRLEISAPALGLVKVAESTRFNQTFPGRWELVLSRLSNLNELSLSSDTWFSCATDSSSIGLSDSIWNALRPLRNLQRLVLDSNCIRSVPRPEHLPSNLRMLSLARNPIVCVCSPPLFPASPTLKVEGVKCAGSAVSVTNSSAFEICLKNDSLKASASHFAPFITILAGVAGTFVVIIIAAAVVATFRCVIKPCLTRIGQRRSAVAASSNRETSASNEGMEEEPYAYYERPITVVSYCSSSNPYEELSLPLPRAARPTAKSRRFFWRSETQRRLPQQQQLPPPLVSTLPPARPPTPPPLPDRPPHLMPPSLKVQAKMIAEVQIVRKVKGMEQHQKQTSAACSKNNSDIQTPNMVRVELQDQVNVGGKHSAKVPKSAQTHLETNATDVTVVANDEDKKNFKKLPDDESVAKVIETPETRAMDGADNPGFLDDTVSNSSPIDLGHF